MKIRLTLCVLSVVLLIGSATAQTDVMFRVRLQSDPAIMSAESRNLLKTKTEQILGRCKALTEDAGCEYTVDASVAIEDVRTTEGLARNSTVIIGELTLKAQNSNDSVNYFTMTVPLRSVTDADTEDRHLAIVKSIKPNSPQFVRFVNNSRKAITERKE